MDEEMRELQIDAWTKFVLTIIAGALCVLVAQNAITPAIAAFGDCGSFLNPCYIKVQQ